jgi:poly(3-hydroxybutyrate) depolymerase
LLNTRDVTLPDLIYGNEIDSWGSVAIINATAKPSRECVLLCSGESLAQTETAVPIIQPMSVRKVGFALKGRSQEKSGETSLELALVEKRSGQNKELDRVTIPLRIVRPEGPHKKTYISSLDGSIQHYAITPAKGPAGEPAALFLSLHGANVEALNQVRSYHPKTWGHIVAPTNRRPYGYNWEDWGRIDALDVLELVQRKLKINPDRVYLTGHSMGGHGVWQIGGLFPDRFAAIGPSAGWISFWSYKVRNAYENPTPLEKMLMRANLPSDTFALAPNYSQQGVYILHGSNDDNVPVNEARQMAAELAKFHEDYIYHEEQGAGHWWDVSPEAGVDCVDWAPLFDFFARHARPSKEMVREIHFVTPCPGISASNNWLTIEAQKSQLQLSRADIRVDPAGARISGTTDNVACISFDLSVVEPKEAISVELDKQTVPDIPWPKEGTRIWLMQDSGKWTAIPKPSPAMKGPHRYGLFKDAIKNQVIFVYGTKGTSRENAWAFAKARYDAETFWYQGNGSVDVIADTEFEVSREPDRNVVLYGNAETNAAWKLLLKKSPVQVHRNEVIIGTKEIPGKDVACLFIRPRPGSERASIGVISGTGLAGMRAADNIPYLYAGYNFPDCLVFTPKVLTEGSKGVEGAGFFGLDWSVETGELVWKDKAK